jgi:ABC-type multidrug transport system ATPase subunit
MKLYATLAGVPDEHIISAAMTVICKVGLQMFIETQAGNLSGGNKRKLCLAMALIGRPKILFIDEASAGVDPGSRRVMWNAIKDEGQESAIVITTHAMEEAEAISDKIAIMVGGQLKCFGSLKEIQTEHGMGYEIELNIDTESLNESMTEFRPEEAITSDKTRVLQVLEEITDFWAQDEYPKAIDPVEEFSRGGIFSNYISRISKGEQIDLNIFRREVLFNNAVGCIINELSMKASEATV